MNEVHDDLYYRALVPIATLSNLFPNLSWKSTRISDGSVLYGGGWFAVGIQTPKDLCIFHFRMNDWDLFKCKEIDRIPKREKRENDILALLSLEDANR